MLGWNGYKYRKHELSGREKTYIEDIEKYEEENEKKDIRRFWWIVIIFVVIPILLALLQTCNPKHRTDGYEWEPDSENQFNPSRRP